MKPDPEDVLDTMIRIRNSAIEQGLADLAVTYRWSVIRLAQEVMAEQYARTGQKP